MVIGIIGKFTATYQGIVTIVKLYSDHTPSCIHFFCLILIDVTQLKMYACLIYKVNTKASLFAST